MTSSPLPAPATATGSPCGSGDGSDVVEGKNGTDTLDFNGAGVDEKMSLSPNGHRSPFLRDVANIRMDMGDVEQLDLTTLGGVDTFTVDNMSGTDFHRADVDLSGPTGGGDALADIRHCRPGC